ncbi:f-box domain-containing protein [Trichonephila clavipes]|nr:f-box domain-containing protein [Trichonephila clavipes]
MRAIGKGGTAARIFCGLMNLPPPPAKFERHNSLFLNVLKTISEDSMNSAVHEAVIANDNNSNIAVAVDGTWHKRGYSSLNGVVCATSLLRTERLSTLKLSQNIVLHVRVKKNHVKIVLKITKDSVGEWNVGVLSIFQRSETSRKACYTQYLSDGDSKGFHTIKEAKVYGDTEVEKLECVGHMQKRMGTRLRNILKMSKCIKLSDGKNISGRGRLTLKEVDSTQHYYGLAIRKNLSSVEDMKRAIWAIYFHKLSTEDNLQHALCPLGEDSWCCYNRSIVTGEFYIHKHSLPESILLKVKKVFQDLTEKDLLKKCLHGRTQNPNESFNKCIFERIPKTVFVGNETLKFGVMDAVICFNDGYVSRIKVFEALGIKPGYKTERALLIIDNKRIFEAERIEEAKYLLDDVVYNCGETIKSLRLINCSKEPYAMLHPVCFVNIHTLTISPQHLGEENVLLLANTQLRNLNLLQTKQTENAVSVSFKIWRECSKISPLLRVHHILEGPVETQVIWQDGAPIRSIIYDTPEIKVSISCIFHASNIYCNTLEVFAYLGIPQYQMQESFEDRPDTSLILLSRCCPFIDTLVIRDRISTATILLLASQSRNLRRLVVRRRGLIQKCDWPHNPEWSDSFYDWLRKTSVSIEKTKSEVSRILECVWHPLTEEEFRCFRLQRT